MNNELLDLMSSDKKVAYILLIAEKVFSIRKIEDEKYFEGRRTLDKCWQWVEGDKVSGDDLYELIDNEECSGVSEYASEEETKDMKYMWHLVTDAVCFASWSAYKEDGEKYLPQILEGIHRRHMADFNKNVLITGLMKEDEIMDMMKKFCLLIEEIGDDERIKKMKFMKII
ncbi:Imm6 family immunity protein [Clostridium sp. JS66]|uniref:Imm6 family immunity protein n=1 Tax=Clostridium sp. JS66 TaxID=3064705 RepID=UPI00298E5D24|nr:Imm6 family immunity protein [Clostridium sp. JS66]WPC42635.1 Imm6 family immunity protein [Clostridium sp. JS66]